MHHQAGMSLACHHGVHSGTLPHEDGKDQKAVTLGISRAATCYLKINQRKERIRVFTTHLLYKILF